MRKNCAIIRQKEGIYMPRREIYIESLNPVIVQKGQLAGEPHTVIMGEVELENYISRQLFPAGVVPSGAIAYLRQKHRMEIKSIVEYVLAHTPSTKENPVPSSKLKEVLKMAIVESGIDLDTVRSYDEAEVHDWKFAKASGEPFPFRTPKKR